ncbi:MAG: hypothetical protein Barrevirus42_1, partial [Barrevirus sp.]
MANRKNNSRPKKQFIDAYNLYLNIKKDSPNTIILFSTGSLNPDSLTTNDVGKHGAIYIQINDIPEFFDKKKFSTNTKLKKHFQDCQQFAQKYLGPKMQNNSNLTVEIMGIQLREYNKIPDSLIKTVVIPHGQIIASGLDNNELEELCENSVFEGYVVLNKEDGKRYKLKREYFHNKAEKSDRQRGSHKVGPEQYTDIGLALCGSGVKGYGYDCAAISQLISDSEKEEIIAELNKDTKLVVLPLSKVIETQNKYPFDGDKMLNLYETVGKGITY